LIHKEDVWSHADNWMSSASRDLFDHFYRCIKSTYKAQYSSKDKLKLIENIYHLREWKQNCFSAITDSAKKETVIPELITYIKSRTSTPSEREYLRDVVIEEKDIIYDPKVYDTFEDFFDNADHGWGDSKKCRTIVFDLYNNFMQDFSIDNLKKQLNDEKKEYLKSNEVDLQILSKFKNQKKEKIWYRFWIDYLREGIDLC